MASSTKIGKIIFILNFKCIILCFVYDYLTFAQVRCNDLAVKIII